MDFKQLKAFSVVAQLQNFSRASELLHVSQSALSKQIAKIEDEVGSRLFDRNGKNIRLNASGMRFYEYCTQTLRENKRVEDDIKFISQSEGICIRIGAAAFPDNFPLCMAAFRKQYPLTEYILTNRIEDEAHLDINEFDVLICPDEFRFKNLHGLPFFTERYFFAVPLSDRFSSVQVFSNDLLKEQTIVFLRRHHQSPEYSFHICSALSLDAASFFYTDTRDLHRKMISSGMAVGFVPQSEAESYRADPGIHLLPILNNRFHRPMKICFLREKYLNEQARLFRSFLLDYYGLPSALTSS